MARKTTKRKATKKVARKKSTKARRTKRATGGTAKKEARTPITGVSGPTPAATRTLEPGRAMDLLRAWSPSRYSTR